nr:hypothetical protein GCM10020093_026190 [Planobispora longispora]
MGDELHDVVALGGGVLRMAAHVEVEAGAVAQEDVARPPPGDDPAEQVARDLVGGQPPLPPERAGDAVLVLKPEDATIHCLTLFAEPLSREGSVGFSVVRLMPG